MRRLSLILVTELLLLAGCALLVPRRAATATTYYVSKAGSNANSCATAQSPGTSAKLTIDAGVGCLASGDTLEVGTGTYLNDWLDDGICSGASPIPPGTSWATATTIKAAAGATVWIQATMEQPNGCGMIEIDQATSQYIIFDGINLDANDATGLVIGTDLPAHHLRFQNLEIKNSRRVTIQGGASNQEYLNVHIHHCGLHPATEAGAHCYYIHQGSGLVIDGGRVHDANCYGIQLQSEGQYSGGAIVRNVEVFNNGCGGIIAGSGQTFYNNVIYNNSVGSGIAGASGNQYLSNIVTGNGQFGIRTNSGAITVKNNIVVANTGGDIVHDSETVISISDGSTNICSGTGGAYRLACTAASTPAALFIAPGSGNFRPLPTSPAVNAGVTLGSPYNVDKDGNLRTAGGYDIGAYEFVTANPPVATSLAFSVQPSTTVVNAAITPAVAVEVRDQFGAVFPSTASITLSLGANPGGGTLMGTTTQNASGGTATFPGLSLTATGVGKTLVASTIGLSNVTSSTFTITGAGAPAFVWMLEQPTPALVNQPITPAPSARIVDSGGNTVTTSTATVTMALQANPTGATLNGTTSRAAVAGIATFPDLSVNTMGSGYTLGVSSTGLGSDQSQFFTITASGAAAHTTAIKVDQLGYRPDMTKVAVLSDPQAGFNVAESYTPGPTLAVRRTSDQGVVFSGAPTAWSAGATHTQSGDKVWWFDFSAVTTADTYQIYDATNNVYSDSFVIHDTVYSDLLRTAVRTFFYQRSGFAKATPYTDARWVDGTSFLASNQDPGARLVTDQGNATTARDLRGGWFDAGDYNKYTTFASNTLQDLLLMYEQFPALFPDTWGLPESGNGMSDLLDEVKWELDWLLRMQQANGSVLSKVSSLAPVCSSPPSADTVARFYGAASTASTASAAAAYALGAKVFTAAGQTAYGTTLRTAAENAWAWAQANPNVAFANTGFGTANPEPSGTYGRGMEVLRAAIFLYALTGNTTYRTYVDAHYGETQPIMWTYWYGAEQTLQEGLLYYTTTAGATSAVVTAIQNSKTSSIGGSEFTPAYTGATDAYRAYVKDADYTWGSNQTKSKIGNLYLNMLQYNLSPANHATYRSAGAAYLHYLHGVNPMGLVYLTHLASLGAERSSNEQYHCWFWDGTDWDSAQTSPKGPAPGFLAGGPNPSYTGDQTPPLGQPIQKAYRDWNSVTGNARSYEITEPANYYQAAYLRLLAHFTAHASPPPPPTDLVATPRHSGLFFGR